MSPPMTGEDKDSNFFVERKKPNQIHTPECLTLLQYYMT